MIFLSPRFLSLISEYGRLEDRLNRDYSEPIQTLALREYSRLVAIGSDPEVARTTINQALSAMVKRYPVELVAP